VRLAAKPTGQSPGHDPAHWLSGDARDQVVVAVVMQHGDTFPFGHGRDQEVREADRPDLPAVPQPGLDIEGPPPVCDLTRHGPADGGFGPVTWKASSSSPMLAMLSATRWRQASWSASVLCPTQFAAAGAFHHQALTAMVMLSLAWTAALALLGWWFSGCGCPPWHQRAAGHRQCVTCGLALT
jgi:hypothetical protein